jgi:hypothetical protein
MFVSPCLSLNDDQRRAAGWSLLAVGIVTTIPLLINLLAEAE